MPNNQKSWHNSDSDKMVASISPMTSSLLQQRIIRHPKRYRSAFTTEQINYLEMQFRKFPYISQEHRKEVAAHLKMHERAIKIWFQNRRMREKKESYKECANETGNNNPQEFGKDQLNNVHAVPSTNDLRPHSLLAMPSTIKIADKTRTGRLMSNKTNIIEEKVYVTNKAENSSKHIKASNQKHGTHQIMEALPSQHKGTCFHHMLPFTLNTHENMKTSGETSALPVDTCGKYTSKQELAASSSTLSNIFHGQKTKKSERNLPQESLDFRTASKEKINRSKDLSSSHKPVKVPMDQPYVLTVPTNLDLQNSGCYTVMPTICAPQIMSSDGVVWRPINAMFDRSPNNPLVALNTRAQRPTAGQKCCKCDCHENTPHIPMFSQTLQHPCAQYVISIPFQNTDTKFNLMN